MVGFTLRACIISMHQQQQSACSQAEHHDRDRAAKLGNYGHLL
jgi:hypothetical protein